jgi:hypothetical protein
MAVKWVEYATGKKIDTVLSEQGKSRNPGAFTDTSDPDILAAFALGITSGIGNNQFNPNGQFTREQAATMIMNTCKAIGANTANPRPSGFADLHTASSWAHDGINFVGTNSIMAGTGNNNFSPKTTFTREQSIVTFNNIKPCELLGEAATLIPNPTPPPSPHHQFYPETDIRTFTCVTGTGGGVLLPSTPPSKDVRKGINTDGQENLGNAGVFCCLGARCTSCIIWVDKPFLGVGNCP